MPFVFIVVCVIGVSNSAAGESVRCFHLARITATQSVETQEETTRIPGACQQGI